VVDQELCRLIVIMKGAFVQDARAVPGHVEA
jgi:hypothetical protein